MGLIAFGKQRVKISLHVDAESSLFASRHLLMVKLLGLHRTVQMYTLIRGFALQIFVEPFSLFT